MTFFTILGSLTFVVFSIVFNGYVFSILWKWFIVNVFNLPILTITQAIGISCVIRFLTVHNFEKEEVYNSPEQMISSAVKAIFYPIFVLLVGYIVYLFM